MDHTDISSPILDGGEGCVVGGEDEEADAVREKREHLYMYSATGGYNMYIHMQGMLRLKQMRSLTSMLCSVSLSCLCALS